MQCEKMSIFISHITEETQIAKVFKDWLESTLLGQYEVFVSSDSRSIQAGEKWLEQIEMALEKAKVMLILFSKRSIDSPWINFEAGCVWTRKTAILPIVHSGLSLDDLTMPISSYYGLILEDSDFCQKFFSAIAKHFNIAKLPKISYDEMHKELINASKEVFTTEKTVESIKQIVNNPKLIKANQEKIFSYYLNIYAFYRKCQNLVNADVIVERDGNVRSTKAEYLENLDEFVREYNKYEALIRLILPEKIRRIDDELRYTFNNFRDYVKKQLPYSDSKKELIESFQRIHNKKNELEESLRGYI